ncbi:MAG: GNAT family N-acetyltransferase, partial [Thermoanaerobaculia bacterium]
PNMVLRIDPRWKSFGGYLSALSGRYRKLVRDRRQAFEAAGLTLERARPTPIAAELAELYANVWQRAPTRMAQLTPAFFRAVEDHLRDSFRLWVVRRQNRLIAFVCALHDRLSAKGRNALLGLFLGLDYGENEEHRLYWNLLYRLVEEAIAEGFDTLDLGRTALQAKAELGAQPQPLHCFIRHRNPSANALMRVLFEQVVEPARAPERHALR